MAHYAFITAGIVTEVIVGRDENDLPDGITSWENYYTTKRAGQICKRTSYNNNIRKQFAGIGYTYDADADVFVAPQPFPSWTLDDNHDWQPPVPYPDDGGKYVWNETTQQWVAI